MYWSNLPLCISVWPLCFCGEFFVTLFTTETLRPTEVHRERLILRRLSQAGAVQIQLGRGNHFDLRKFLLQGRQKLLRVANHDHAGAISAETRRSKALHVGRFDCLNARDIAIDFIQAYAVQRQRAHLTNQSARSFHAARETADETRLARSQFAIWKIARGELWNFRERQRRDLSTGFPFGLPRSAE